MAIKLTQQRDGRFARNLGYLSTGSQPKFYLGRDERDAVLRAAQLEKLWEWRSEICEHTGDVLAWDEITLTVAKAIASGSKTVAVQINAPADLAVGMLSGLQSAAPQIAIRLIDENQQKEGEQYWRETGAELMERARSLIQMEGNQRLHEAIDAYIKTTETTYALPTGGVTEWGMVKIRQITFCKINLPDDRLADLDTERIDSLLAIIASRPISRKFDEPISKVTAQATIKEFRQFLRWLHKSKEYCWRRPDDYERTPVRIALSAEERSQIGALSVKTYSTDQLQTLWTYATPWERSLIILGLNCGFGIGEIATLRHDELYLNQAHRLADHLQMSSDDRDSWAPKEDQCAPQRGRESDNFNRKRSQMVSPFLGQLAHAAI